MSKQGLSQRVYDTLHSHFDVLVARRCKNKGRVEVAKLMLNDLFMYMERTWMYAKRLPALNKSLGATHTPPTLKPQDAQLKINCVLFRLCRLQGLLAYRWPAWSERDGIFGAGL
eukprot:4266755-Prymnesium_polylepis.1